MANKKIIDLPSVTSVASTDLFYTGNPSTGNLSNIASSNLTKSLLPNQTGNDGKVLTTDGSTLSWETPNTEFIPTIVGLETSNIVSYIQDRYQAFPSIAMDRVDYSYAVCIWKDAPNHIPPGNLKWCLSNDGFVTFTTPVTINVDGNPVNNAGTGMIGIGNNGRSIIAYNTGTGGTTDLTILHFAKSDTRDNNFISTTTMTTPVGIDWIYPFGKTIIMPESGELRMLGYCQETAITAGQTSTCYYKSTDNGDSWTFGGIIIHGGNINVPFPGWGTFPIAPSEADWDIIETDGTDANTKLVLITRDDVNYRHIQCFSNDGGVTWTNTLASIPTWTFGDTIPGSPDGFWPCTVLVHNKKLYAIHGLRMPYSTAANFSMRIFEADALSVYNDPRNWNPTTSHYDIYRPTTYYKYSYTDWGYPWMVIAPSGKIRALFYDGDPRGAVNFAIAPTTDIKAIDIENNNYYQAYNTTNESIPAGTSTALTLNINWLDSERAYNLTDNKLRVPSDGFYNIYTQVKLTPDNTGTYRQLAIYLVDEGLFAHNPSDPNARLLVGRQTIAPSLVAALNYIELNTIAYLNYNYLIQVELLHDASSNLTIDNSSTDRAFIKFVKIK